MSEIPIKFEHRNAGESKASLYEVWRFLRLLIRLRTTGDQHFLQFVAVGASGIFVNSAILAFVTEWLHIYYLFSVALATVGSTLWNFAFTELWVYRDRQQDQSWARRFVVFFVINSAALALRGPIVYVLTIVMGGVLSDIQSPFTCCADRRAIPFCRPMDLEQEKQGRYWLKPSITILTVSCPWFQTRPYLN